jgi:four helix bundle protein
LADSSPAAPRGPVGGEGPRVGPPRRQPKNDRTTRIYRRSLDLIDLVARISKTLPPGYAFLADQPRRSSSSIALNYLEGCGRTSMGDRRRFFVIASGSAHEVAATLDVMSRFGVLSDEDRRIGHDLCDHLVAMLRRFR